MILRFNENCKDATLVASSSLPNYPVENILDSRLTTLYRSDLITDINIVFDCGAAVDVNSIVIDKHNISGNVTVLRLEGNSIDDWSNPPLSIDLTYEAERMINDFDKETYQFWRLVITDLSNTEGFLQFSRVWIGESYKTIGIGVEVPDEYESLSVKSQSLGGNTYLDIRDKRTLTAIRIPKLDDTEKAKIRSILDVVDIGIPFYITFDKAGDTIGQLYATLNQNSIRFTKLGNTRFWSTVLELLEEI